MRTISQFLFDGFSFGYTIVTDDGKVWFRALTKNRLRKGANQALASLDVPVGTQITIYSLKPWRAAIVVGYAERKR